MDPACFDSLTRSLARPTTRRGLLGGFIAVIMGARAASALAACPPGQSPNAKGQCSCPAGTDACSEGCVDRKRDARNCGRCGNACLPGEICQRGECRCPRGATCGCPPGASLCNGTCLALDVYRSDTNNCGGCGIVCNAPANAVATCGENGCGFVCNEGYTVTQTGDACVSTNPCPTGYEQVNEGCFQIVADLDRSLCTNTCEVYGSVPGSDNFLCGLKVPSFDVCASDSDCAADQFCRPHIRGNYCVRPC